MLYPGSAKPLYEQLKELIVQKINSGELKPGNRLPGERVLEEKFGVSRITIRQAIGELANEGVLHRQHGKGTFVTDRRIERPLATLLGVAEELALDGMDVRMKILDMKLQASTPEVKSALSLSNNEDVYLISRLVIVDGRPVSIDYSYLPQAVGYKLLNSDLEKDIIYTILESCGYKISEAEQNISSDAANVEEAGLLGYKPKWPVLIVKRTTFVEGQLPIIYSRVVYRADRYEYHIRLKRHVMAGI